MTLAKSIAIGRKSIAAARQRGIDTSGWEVALAELERQQLMLWASELGQADKILAIPITYRETPLRPITTTQVSQSVRIYLKTVARAEIYRATGGWKEYPPEWWEEQANQALGALKALRSAMDNVQGEG